MRWTRRALKATLGLQTRPTAVLDSSMNEIAKWVGQVYDFKENGTCFFLLLPKSGLK